MARQTIYVFGSNEGGYHGAGTALAARQFYGALMYVGVGPTGDSYAIPTKDKNLQTLPLERIAFFVRQFGLYAKAHPELLFHVTKVGCGLAGYDDYDIAGMFEDMPDNVGLPGDWITLYAEDDTLRCDHCTRLECASDLTPDWNSETGNHLSCEAQRCPECGAKGAHWLSCPRVGS